MSVSRVERLSDSVTLYLGDNAEVQPPPGAAIVSDPPYGMRHNTDSRRFSGVDKDWGGGRSVPKWAGGAKRWTHIVGDDAPFDPVRWLTHKEVILFGANHFLDKLPPGGLLVWIKQQPHLFGTFPALGSKLTKCRLGQR